MPHHCLTAAGQKQGALQTENWPPTIRDVPQLTVDSDSSADLVKYAVWNHMIAA